MDFLSHSEAETESLGRRLAERLSPGAVVAYRGDLGMGKTAFTRGLAQGLGCRARVLHHCERVCRRPAPPVSL